MNTLACSTAVQLCHQLFEAQVSRSPSAVAIQFGEDFLTYQQLNCKANQLARHLQELGVSQNVPVGLCIERSLDTIVAILGILKAGGAYLPLDPSYPAERLAFMLQNAQVPVLVTQRSLARQFMSGQQIVFCIDADWPAIAVNRETNLSSVTMPADLAYIIYTSGSTGQPKGVAMPHQPLVNLVQWQTTQSQVKAGKTLQFTPISFDVSFQEIFSTLSAGGTLILIDDQKRRDPEYLRQTLVEQEINRLFLPFVALNHLADAIAASGQVPSQLQEVITAGEQLRITEAIADWFRQAPDCTLSNHYGPSESHVVTAYTLSGAPEDWSQLPPIGTPIDNAEIYLLDRQTLIPVTKGEIGEIYIGGVSLAQGYLHRTDLTAERFLANPFTQDPDDRLYKSGDLARRLPDGNLEYLGRADEQVKIRGIRIEPGEVEALMEQHPAVQKAVVMAREDVPGDKRLVAYAIGDLTQAIETVMEFIKERLPVCMVPSTIVWVEQFPLTPSGKVDRRSLPAPEYSRDGLGTEFAAPETVTEEILADLWKQVLNLDRIGIHDYFFDLGGDSLKVIQLVHRTRDAFRIELPMLVLFDAPTIKQFAQVIDEAVQQRNAGMMSEVRIATTDDISIADLRQEAVVDANITVEAGTVPTVTAPNHVLITGVTGFVGAFLLSELLAQTNADIHCLVRAKDQSAGWAKVYKNLAKYRLWKPSYATRIVPVIGDLAKPRLGLTPAAFDDLAATVEGIYHSGAVTSLIKPYADLRDVNVAGTEELLRLATQTQVKPFHFISTLDIFQTAQAFSAEPITEHDPLNPHEAVYFDGYAKSKWVSEMMLEEARSRGLPACIYRPVMITGHTQSGAANTGDLMNRLIKGFIELGAAPDFDMVFNVVPVDHFSQSTIYLSLQPESIGKNFNCINPNPPSMRRFVEVINECGYPVESVDHATWESLLSEHVETLDSIVHVLTSKAKAESWSYIERSSVGADQVSCQNVLDGLAETAIACPDVTAKMLSPYFQFFAEVGFLDLPEASILPEVHPEAVQETTSMR
ncbi:MAG: amino acid adenylation domain-containing protein [Spirulina sp. SIO3F2]|nr:amino acid adenylation domain-containing protein [Spirulina sp. SIO3F2]